MLRCYWQIMRRWRASKWSSPALFGGWRRRLSITVPPPLSLLCACLASPCPCHGGLDRGHTSPFTNSIKRKFTCPHLKPPPAYLCPLTSVLMTSLLKPCCPSPDPYPHLIWNTGSEMRRWLGADPKPCIWCNTCHLQIRRKALHASKLTVEGQSTQYLTPGRARRTGDAHREGLSF